MRNYLSYQKLLKGTRTDILLRKITVIICLSILIGIAVGYITSETSYTVLHPLRPKREITAETYASFKSKDLVKVDTIFNSEAAFTSCLISVSVFFIFLSTNNSFYPTIKSFKVEGIKFKTEFLKKANPTPSLNKAIQRVVHFRLPRVNIKEILKGGCIALLAIVFIVWTGLILRASLDIIYHLFEPRDHRFEIENYGLSKSIITGGCFYFPLFLIVCYLFFKSTGSTKDTMIESVKKYTLSGLIICTFPDIVLIFSSEGFGVISIGILVITVISLLRLSTSRREKVTFFLIFIPALILVHLPYHIN